MNYGYGSIPKLMELLSFIALVLISYGSSVFVYKQELRQADVYLDELLPNATSFNATEYNLEITDACPLIKLMEDQQYCQAQVCAKHAQRSAFWTPKKDIQKFHQHHLPDCLYAVSFQRAAMETRDDHLGALEFVEYSFLVQQNCTGSNVTIVGGTTFHLFAYSNDAIAICTTTDFFNGTYSIECSVPVLSSSVPRHCIYLTVVLDHEHFDAYSLVLGTNDVYSSVRQTLLDNVTFCAEIDSSMMFDNVNSNDGVVRLRRSRVPTVLMQGRETAKAAPTESAGVNYGEKNVASVFSGLWVRQEPPPTAISAVKCVAYPLFVALENCSVPPSPLHCRGAWVFNVNASSGDDQRKWYMPQWKLLTTASASYVDSPSWWNNRRGCMLDAIGYKNGSNHFQPLDTNIPAIASSTSLVYAFAFRPLKLDVGIGGRYFDWSMPRFTSRIQLLRQESKNSMVIKFIGASHMRYLMMSMLEVVYGLKTLQDIHRKVHKCSQKNMDYDTARYASEHVAVMKQTCGDWGLDAHINNTNNGVFVVQAGDWDLTVGVSRFLRDPSFGLALVTFLKRLLEGEVNCPALRHVIYVTGVPHPVCMSDSGKDYCADGRKFRTNSAIAAVNTFVLRHLLAVKVHPSMKLSIVDAFSIISQRMMMNENYETVCTNHYSCDVPVGRRANIMAHTIGGMAVVQSLAYALVLV